MKNGFINTVAKDALIDMVIMPKIIAVTAGVAGFPLIRQFVRWIVDEVLVDDVMDELQRFYNFVKIAKEEGDKLEEVKKTEEELRKHEQPGKTKEELLQDPEARKAYEAWKKAVGEQIRRRHVKPPA